ncbi:MAG TPA: uracil-DNA glycosylase [Mariprofundaceae bacterium]|nr:uracil-DNA glycosylase [Mariprofundaceae bacterium]
MAADDAQAYYLKQIGVHTPLPPSPARNEQTVAPSPEVSHEPATLQDLARDAAGCVVCPLSEERTQVVFGVGNPNADLVFIGEAPGRDEDLKGEPFVGRAGRLLDRMLVGLGLDRTSVYIMNVVKCHPSNNRDPRPEEIEACSRWFDAQLRLLSPKVICVLGRVAAQSLLETDAPLGSLRGRWHEYHDVPVWVTYHPAYLLRSPHQKARAWEDLRSLQKRCMASGD